MSGPMKPILHQHRDFSFVIIRPGGKGSFSFRVNSWILYSLFSVIGVALLTISFSVYFYTSTSAELAQYDQVKTQYVAQEAQFQELEFKADEIYKTLDSLLEKEAQIKYILETANRPLTSDKKKTELSPSLSLFQTDYQQLKSNPAPQISRVSTLFSFLDSTIGQLNSQFGTHHSFLKQLQVRFASTPSIWPVHGRIRSGFGSRFHPLMGAQRFHAGIDIPAPIGAAIRASADGIVNYAGWSGSYGYVVILEHGYGYRTVYAHASQLLVQKGEAVKKGQSIAQVGTTGLSTGPHLHYEVQRWSRPLSPSNFLDVDMFTASARLW